MVSGMDPDGTLAPEQGIMTLLERRAPGKTICPSEAARFIGGPDWRHLMPAVRDAAWRLAAGGQVVILQKGRPVERAGVRGPIRIALARPGAAGRP